MFPFTHATKGVPMKQFHLNGFLRRSCSAVLALALCIPPAVLADEGKARIQTSQTILDGLTYTNTVSEHTSGRVESFLLELEEDSRVFPILLQSSGTVYGTATVNAAVKRAQEMGYQVLAAVNTDYFSTATGVPQGIVIEDGIYKSDPVDSSAILVVDDEVVLCEEPVVELKLTNEDKDLEIVPNYFNKYRASTGGVYLLNEHFSTVSTRTTTPGWFVLMKVANYDPEDKDCQLTVNSELELEVIDMFDADQPIAIREGEYILTADDVSNKRSVFESFEVGDRITLKTECDDDDLSEAQWAGGVGDTIVEKNEATDPADWTLVDNPETIRAPRTALGVRRNGTLVLYAVDGRQSKHSVGLTVTDLADQMEELDCRWAVNLDGGGSTTASVWLPGQSGISLQNSPSDGKARSCATYLLLVSDKEGNGEADRLALTENGITVLAETAVKLPEAVVLDNMLNILDEEFDDLTVTSRTGLGEIEDGIYYADDDEGTDRLRLRSRDLGITGEAVIHVVEELSTFSVTADGKTLSGSLSVKPGQSIQLGASGTYWGRTALHGLTGVEIELDESVGTIDETGLLTVANTAKSGNTITFSAGGLEQEITLSVANLHTDVGEDHWGYAAVEYCYANNIVSGISPTQFGPNGLIRRADFMLMLYAALGRPEVTTPCTFTDVSESDYYYTALAWAQTQGLISGGGDGSCAATASITREQAFTILRKAMPLLGKVFPDAPLSALAPFADKDTIADYAKVPAATLVAQGVVSGSGSGINPKGNLTRVEMAALLYKISTYTPVTEYPELEPDPIPEIPVQPEAPEEPDAPAVEQPPLPITEFPIGTVTGAVTNAENGLNVRAGAGTVHEVQGKLRNGNMVIILEKLEGWHRVLYRSEEGAIAEGYVSASYVTIDTLAGTVTNAENGLNVRAGAGTSFEAQFKLKNGAAVVVAEQLEGWHRIWYLNDKAQITAGYVSADYITLAE